MYRMSKLAAVVATIGLSAAAAPAAAQPEIH